MKKWWENGVRFECQGSGRCCQSRGQYGYVYLSKTDQRNLALYLGVSQNELLEKYCDTSDGLVHIKEEPEAVDCRFLKNHRCEIYEARPTQCKTWPFWPENMNAKAWNNDIKEFCPGVDKGKLLNRDSILESLNLQKESEREMGIES